MLQRIWEALTASLEWVDAHNGLVTAAATVFIGAFTWVLARVTGRQVRLAREEFIATHRPRIVVHAIEVAYDTTNEDDGTVKLPTLGAEIICFNVGDMDAVIVELNASIQYREVPLRAGIMLPRIALKPVTVKTGEQRELAVGSVFEDKTLRIAERGAAGRPLLCIGTIIYRDAAGVRRQTGFCRQYATLTGEGRWHEYKSYETKLYEYAY